MPVTERLGASSRCYMAPAIDRDQAKAAIEAMKVADLTAHNEALNKIIANLVKASHGYSVPRRYMAGVPNGWPQSVELPSNIATSNERSKPVGLKDTVHYEDADGRTLTVGHQNDRAAAKGWIRTSSSGAYVKDADIVPIALNVLGYDRPELGKPEVASFAGSSFTYAPVASSSAVRNELLAGAVANLRAIDLYDQHLVKKKADEEAAAKAAEAEAAKEKTRRAEVEELRRIRNDANGALHAAARRLGDVGIYDVSIAELTDALVARKEAQSALAALTNS